MATIEWPLESFTITDEFDAGRAHTGIDLAAPTGTPIYATDTGIVEASGDGSFNSWMGQMAGLYVLIRHAWGFSGYAHMSGFIVGPGQSITRGQLLGYVGSTGASTGPHCHFETLPLSPNFSNGYAGRVNPRSAHVLVPHGTNPPVTPQPLRKKKKDMLLIHRPNPGTNADQYPNEFAVVGTNFWVAFATGQSLANAFAAQLGDSIPVTPSLWDRMKTQATS